MGTMVGLAYNYLEQGLLEVGKLAAQATRQMTQVTKKGSWSFGTDSPFVCVAYAVLPRICPVYRLRFLKVRDNACLSCYHVVTPLLKTMIDLPGELYVA
jgi:hypothetical protein